MIYFCIYIITFVIIGIFLCMFIKTNSSIAPIEDDLQLKQIEYQCKQMQMLYDNLSDEDKKTLFGNCITAFPDDFHNK